MEKLMEIKSVKVQNFGCIKDLDMKLTPLHAVIGPNDAGKSTLLRAVRTGMQLLADRFYGGFPEYDQEQKCRPFHPGLHDNANISFFSTIDPETQFKYELLLTKNNVRDQWMFLGKKAGEIYLRKGIHLIKPGYEKLERSVWDPNNIILDLLRFAEVTAKLPRMVRLDPDSLRKPGDIYPSSKPINFKEKGFGLASVLDSLMNRNIDGYISIRDNIRKLFPSTDSFNLKNIEVIDYDLFERGPKGNPVEGAKKIVKTMEIILKNGSTVSSNFISEGMLYYIAFSALQYLEPASILLIEEPENGLHPSRIKEIMSIIRELSKTTQVLIATHSPLVINEMEPEEVTILWRDDEKGTQAMPIAETSNFKDRSQVYALGELWLSYADGINEMELRTGKE
jgi:predicted ATPase